MPQDQYDPSLDLQLEICKNEIQGWRNSAYALNLRARIAKKAGDDDESKRHQAEAEKACKRIDLYLDEQKALEKAIAAQKTGGGKQ